MNDILLVNDDLSILNGDFEIGNSDLQNALLIVRLRQGNIKQEPLIGFGEERLINGIVDGAVRREIQLQLQSDGYRMKRFNVIGEQIEIGI